MNNFNSKSKILRGSKLSLLASALLVSSSLTTANAAVITIDTALTAKQNPSGVSNDIHITSGGSVTTTNESALEISTGGIEVSHFILNEGSLVSSSSGSVTTLSHGYDLLGTLTNTGSISATGTGNGSAIDGIYSSALSGTLTNSGDITATGTGSHVFENVVGIRVTTLNAGSNLTNEVGGTISSLNGSATYGIKIDTFSFGATLTNHGEIVVSSDAGQATGIMLSAFSNFKGDLVNTGMIKVNSESGTAHGISSNVAIEGTILNTGTIIATQNNELDNEAYSLFLQDGDATVTNGVGGKLYGNINVRDLISFINEGLISLSPYQGSSAKIDEFTNKSTGILEIRLSIDDIGGKTYSRLQTVNAEFQSGSTIVVNVLDSSTDLYLSVGTTLANVVTASTSLTILGTLNITDNSALLNFEYVKNGNAIDLNIVQGSTILDSTMAGGGNSSSTSVAKALQTIQTVQYANHPQMHQLISELNKLGTDAQVAAAVASTTPQTVSASVGAASQISNGIAGIVEQRQQANTGSGLNSGDETFSSKNVWVKTYGSVGTQDNKDGINGFDVNTYGLGMGIDGEYSRNNTLGIALFYTKADVDVNNVAQSSDMDVFTTVIYGNSPVIDEKTNFLYQFGYALQQTDSSRTLFTNQTATADYTSKTASIDLKLMRDYEINKRFLLQPLVSTTYRHFDNPEYSETGAGANSLNVDAFTSSELLLGVGTLAHYKLDKKSKLIGNVKVDYDVKGDNASVTSSFAGATGVTFGTEGIDNGRWQYEAGIGYERDVQEGHNFNFSYNYQGVGSSFTNHIVSARYMYSF